MKNNKLILRYATKRDFDFFYKGEKLLHSARAWVLVKKRKRYAIGGIWLMKRQNAAFVKVKRDVPKKEFWKVTKIVMQQLKQEGIPIMCFRDEAQLNSKSFLEKLGFRFSGIVENQEIYKL